MGIWLGILETSPTYTFGMAVESVVTEFEDDFAEYWGLESEKPLEDMEVDDWIRLIQIREIARRLARDAARLLRPGRVAPDEWTLPEQLERQSDERRKLIEEFLTGMRDELSTEDWRSLRHHLEPYLPGDPRVQHSFFESAFEIEAAGLFNSNPTFLAERLQGLLAFAARRASQTSANYLSRVAECYVRNMKPEFAAMSRAVLESTLQDRILAADVEHKVGLNRANELSLDRYFQYCLAKEIYDETAYNAADRVRSAGDDALHGKIDRVPDPDSLLPDLARAMDPLQKLDIIDRD